ncbi:sigma 54-interacting transcriptional regulator [Balneolaceae bacterium ANBcel3]|nr:sigma 54-interacting transcriptional regulator [Balneolaceae bacterium ANBcel3]
MTNSFWREVLDHIPGLVLLFRIDENEEAHLMFINSEVRTVLGYTPEEFVLASETEGTGVKKECSRLVERVAELSHEGDIQQEPICRFFSKRAVEYSFSFEFRIFGVKTSPLPYIAILLKPLKEAGETVKDTAPEKTTLSKASDVGVPFAEKSSLMKAIMQKIDFVADKPMHLLFRGDKGTGKRTLARQILKAEANNGALCVEWDMSGMNSEKQEKAIADGFINNTGSSAQKRVFLISEIGKMSLSVQSQFQNQLQKMREDGRKVRVLATSTMVLEEQVKRGKFSMELYYYLSFENVLIPPLSQRKEDISYLVETWVPKAAAALAIPVPAISESAMNRLLEYDWPGNFSELFQVLRLSLLRSVDGEFRISFDSTAFRSGSDRRSSSEKRELEKILPFDEMNRRYLEDVLKATKGKIYGRDGAARALGMKPTTLQSKLKKLGVR